MSRTISFSVGAFSQREIVGWEHKSAPVSGSPSASQLEGWIGPEEMEIVAVRVAAGHRQHARSEHILDGVGDMRRVARIVNQSGKRSGYRPAALGKRKQDHATVRGKTAAIECGCDFLAADGWQGESK